MSNINFDARKVDPQAPFAPLPAGEYIVQVVISEVKSNRAGTGQYLALQLEVLDGEFKNRRLFCNITLSHTNSTAQQIGQSQLSALCHAVGVMQLTNTSQLHGIPVKAHVKIRTSDQYGEQNDVTGFEAAGNVAASPAPAQQPAAANTPPWQR